MSTPAFGPPQDYYDHLQPQTGIERGTPETDPGGSATALDAIRDGNASGGDYATHLIEDLVAGPPQQNAVEVGAHDPGDFGQGLDAAPLDFDQGVSDVGGFDAF